MTRSLLLSFWVVTLAGAQSKAPQEDGAAVAWFEELIKSGRFTEARAGLQAYTQQHVRSWRAEYQIGYVDFRLHQIQSSVVHICKSLLIHDDFAEAHKILAYDLNILGHPDRAIVELERSIRLNPSLAESHYELGRIYYEQGSYVQAIASLEKAKTLSPSSVRVYHNLGLAYAAVSDNAKAIGNFEEGLQRNQRELKPSAWPLIDYGTYLNLQGKFEKARTMLLESIAIDHRWDQAYDELSKADRGLGRLKDSIDDLHHAIAINASKPEYHYVLAQLYKQTRQPLESKEELAIYRRGRSTAQK